MASTLTARRLSEARDDLSPAEMNVRRERITASFHESIIEGATPDPATNYIFEAYIRGQIEITDLIPWLDKHYGVVRQPE